MRTSSRSVALLLFDEVELLDFAGCLQALSVAGRQWNWRPFKVHTVAPTAGLVQTRNQIRVEARLGLDDLTEPELVFVPGGYGARRIAEDARVVDWLASAGRHATHVLLVGAGALAAGRAGLLEGIEVAISNDLTAALTEAAPGAVARPGARVCESGRVLSASSAAASIDLGVALVRTVLGKKQAALVSKQLGHEATAVDIEPVPVDILEPGPKPGI